jgi:hypothetical protein
LSSWSPISKLTLVHPKSYENKLYYIPFDASRRALQNGVFGFSTVDRSPYPSVSFKNASYLSRKSNLSVTGDSVTLPVDVHR